MVCHNTVTLFQLDIADENASVLNESTTKPEVGGNRKTSKPSTISSTDPYTEDPESKSFVTDTTLPITGSLNKSTRPPVDDGENGTCCLNILTFYNTVT